MGRKYWDDLQTFSQPTDEELKRNTSSSVNKALMRGTILDPVKITGSKITTSWWGNAWCSNLERYADYENRLQRGKRYVKAGTVIDLKIDEGRVTAKVQGSRRTPYNVNIRISPLPQKKCGDIIEKCGKKLQSMEDLLSGKMPKDMQDILAGEDGLFPTPQEISMGCSCPDWAIMCKHVAAVLYGIGARLDRDPLLFFTLRGIDPQKFIGIAIDNRVEEMLKNAGKRSSREIPPSEAGKLFGL